MELFNDAIIGLKKYLLAEESRNSLRRYSCDLYPAWPEQSSMVLQEDTAVELGGSAGSLFMILWTGQAGLIRPGQISVVGSDLPAAGTATGTAADTVKLPLSQIIMVKGSYRDEYETYQKLQDIIIDTRLKEVSTRFWPDRQKTWCRVSREALNEGFSLIRYGCTLIERLGTLASVEEVEVIFTTEALPEKILLTPVAEKVREIIEALLEIYDQLNFDCESCDYKEVCAEVAGLREIHQRLHEEREQT